MATTYTTKLYDRLDKICERHYGSTDNGEVEDLVLPANPGLEAHGIVLPKGLTIILPDRPQAAPIPVRPMVLLWE